MKNLKKAIKRTMCVLLTAAMLCADTGLCVYAAEEKPDVETAENREDISGEESLSENEIEAVEDHLETAAEAAGADVIDSDTYGNIVWVFYADGKLTVDGTGDFSSSDSNERAPWYDKGSSITLAEIRVTGMTDASYMFNGCSNLTSVDVSKFETDNVINMGYLF